jgi:PAS domain S-box-containing protein
VSAEADYVLPSKPGTGSGSRGRGRTTGDVGKGQPDLGTAERGGSAREGDRLRDGEGTLAALRALFDGVLDAVLVATDDREYVDANSAACDLLGVPKEELLGCRLEEFVPEDQRSAAREAWGKFLERGQMEGEIVLRRADGALRVAEFRAKAEFLPGRHLSVLRDVTERKRAEEKLRKSEERHRLIVESALDYAIFATDPEGTIESWSPGAEAVFGWTAEEAVGQATAITFTPEDREGGVPEKERATARRDGSAPDVRWHLRKGGSRIFIEGTNRHLADTDGRTRGFLKIGQNVTERRELERERERLRARELTAKAEAAERERISRELHDRVAHSMAVALQSLELHSALAEAAPHRAVEKLELARESIRRAVDQTRSLAAELRHTHEEELEDGLPAALEAFVRAYVPDGLQVELAFHPGDEWGWEDIPSQVGAQAYLVMREALANAARHSGCERVRMRLEIRDRELVGTVKDDGMGFDPEVAGKAGPAGGVGLRSMRERAEMLGGSLRVASRPEGGTTVEVRLPLDGRG